MDAIEEKLNTINGALADVKTSILSKGQIPSGDITSYADAINSIQVLDGQIRTIAPSTTQQVITPTDSKNAITSVLVSGVTSAIDSNIVAGNIKKNVSILGVTGSFEEGITPTGIYTVTENGTFNIANYEFVQVSIS